MPIGHIRFTLVVVFVFVTVRANIVDGLHACYLESGGCHIAVAVVSVILTLQEGVARGKLFFRDQIAGTTVIIVVHYVIFAVGEGIKISVAVVNVGILLGAIILHLCGSAEDVVSIVDDKAVSIGNRGQPAGLILVGVGGKATQEMSRLKSRGGSCVANI